MIVLRLRRLPATKLNEDKLFLDLDWASARRCLVDFPDYPTIVGESLQDGLLRRYPRVTESVLVVSSLSVW
jgi:hypothetical protein